MSTTVEERDPTKPEKPLPAPGKPGEKPRWSSGAKTGVGTAPSNDSRIWFTVSNGTLNEIYHPDIDKANTRSIRFLIADGGSYFSDEETDATHLARALENGVPGYNIESTCRDGKYRLTKEVVSDPVRDCLLMRVRFEPSVPLQLYLLVDPQIADQGAANNAWIGDYKGTQMLLAQHRDTAMAAACSVPFERAMCGFVGKSDGLRDIKKHYRLTKRYNMATDGNVSLVAELELPASGGEFVVSIAFGEQPAEAAQQVRAGLLQPFNEVRAKFIQEWRDEQQHYRPIEGNEVHRDALYRMSAAMLHTHESKRFPGGFVASLSIPWGFARSDKDIGGYHVLWPRDLVEIAMGKLACGDAEGARRALFYLACTQEETGNWCQNMWLDGTVHWGAEQMDGIALPILLADRLRREQQLGSFDAWPMVCSAALFLVKNGPATQQDRWEAVPGYSVFTMACEVAALLAAADFAYGAGEHTLAEFLTATADAWNDAIDEYTLVQRSEFAEQYGVFGYYMRIAPFEIIENHSPSLLRIKLPNHKFGNKTRKAVEVVSPDVLALVRYGLRAADDPRITATVRLLDATLKHEMTTGPGWKRSTHDGYGEHADGSPFNGRGIGRCWPLLAGERGHYELAAGNRPEAERLLAAMTAQTSECGMIPEQVWDADDLPEHQLFNGKPTGSGMPLAWAHAEYIKLLRSIQDRNVWDTPPQAIQRYQVERRSASFQIWTEREPRKWINGGKQLRMDFCSSASVQWALDSDALSSPAATREIAKGLHSVTLPLSRDVSWKTLRLRIEKDGKVRRLQLQSR